MVEVLVIIISLVLNALLAAYELAFVSVSRPRLRQLASKGNKMAKRLLDLTQAPEKILSIIQLGITAVGAMAAAVGGAEAADNFEPYLIQHFNLTPSSAEVLSLIFVVTPLTFLTVIFGELVPKSLALKNPLAVSLRLTPFIFILDKLFSPIVILLENSTRLVLKTVYAPSESSGSMVQGTIEIDTLSPLHQKLMLNMSLIETKRAKDIMLPWNHAITVDLTDSISHVTQVIFDSGHTRLPVCDGPKVLGILHTKEFLILRDSGEMNWSRIIRSFYRVDENDSALKVLRGMQEKKSHIGIVFSQDESLVGLVTIEDILEEVVGDIADEDDDGTIRKLFSSKGRIRSFSQKSKKV